MPLQDPYSGFRWPVSVVRLITAPSQEVIERNINTGEPRTLPSILREKPCPRLAWSRLA